ncbi:CMGC/SRPK protein kinase [Coprinopsis cinerea okayama7|uniref:non-specific serine/threonine protein kinase n=1 Tax=Coprinopsis cinerea (strain Okayama-7 / 130 / ATCC MYA-4618 / FGSC 9003) TaxID=240176 RepID=A8N140_COPC7|nr:CMGC/SRPK protein kinase [Coprinopsis cinerea okayama7\|eukprot:XP_001828589.1 CMGC/SRPK protein kinase [Coprinopsis cinerea okayama7\
MAPKPPCAKYQYVVTPAGPKIVPVDEPSCKDEESPADYNAGGYLPVKVNDTFKQGRYRVVRKLGWGHFSTVWLVKDSQSGVHSALKVVKSAGRYAETARDEIKLLSRVASVSPDHPGRAHIVSFLDSFSHQGPESSHICIVFEPLGENLLALIERNKKKGVPKALVKIIAKQVLLGLQYLHDECDLVHTDIKPENICFTKSTCLEVTSVRQTLEELDELTRSGIPIQMKGKEKEPEGLSAGSSPLKPSSWIEQASSLSSSYKSKGSPFKSSKPRSSNRHGHSHSQSGAPWQDPGVASPAPAVLVNAVASADGQETSQTAFNSLRTSSSSTSTITIAHSESSSTTATATQPSPTGTPLGPRKTKTMSIINGVSKLISDTSTMLSTGLHPTSETKPNTNTTNRTPQSGETNVTTNHVSLLTQTAPTRISANVEPLRTTTTRPSPPQHISQLSAHMHSEPCPSLPSHDSVLSSHFPSETSRPNFTTVSTAIAQRLVFGTSSSPAPPPPTPVDGPVFGSFPISPPPPFTSQFPNPPPISIKIADLGNATPSKKHFTEDIQTRQYRAPEAIVGRKDWDTRADVWSVACVVFELLTAEYLFDPQGQGELFTKDDDHMAQIIELLGDFPLDVKMGGKYSRELFDHTGALRYIRTLKPWPLKRVMIEKYLYSEEDSDALCAFLEPMLKADMRERAHARDMLDHPWLDVSNEEEVTEW